uniref:Uncharacterized protein n=1 Tax=Cacopsylla melanoneura TaxID=428564 RepID=A0A8D8ZCA4_9HEMI
MKMHSLHTLAITIFVILFIVVLDLRLFHTVSLSPKGLMCTWSWFPSTVHLPDLTFGKQLNVIDHCHELTRTLPCGLKLYFWPSAKQTKNDGPWMFRTNLKKIKLI